MTATAFPIVSLPERRREGSFYRRIVTRSDVERAALHVLRESLPRFIWEVERQEGRTPGTLAEPRSYILLSQFQEQRPEDQRPTVVVLSPGWAGPPRTEGDQSLTATFSLAAGVVADAAGDRERVRENISIYTSAVLSCLISEQSLGGLAAGVNAVDLYDPPELPATATRSLHAGLAGFEVIVENVAASGAGSGAVPPTTPDWPVTQHVEVVTRLVPRDRPLLTLTGSEED